MEKEIQPKYLQSDNDLKNQVRGNFRNRFGIQQHRKRDLPEDRIERAQLLADAYRRDKVELKKGRDRSRYGVAGYLTSMGFIDEHDILADGSVSPSVAGKDYFVNNPHHLKAIEGYVFSEKSKIRQKANGLVAENGNPNLSDPTSDNVYEPIVVPVTNREPARQILDAGLPRGHRIIDTTGRSLNDNEKKGKEWGKRAMRVAAIVAATIALEPAVSNISRHVFSDKKPLSADSSTVDAKKVVEEMKDNFDDNWNDFLNSLRKVDRSMMNARDDVLELFLDKNLRTDRTHGVDQHITVIKPPLPSTAPAEVSWTDRPVDLLANDLRGKPVELFTVEPKEENGKCGFDVKVVGTDQAAAVRPTIVIKSDNLQPRNAVIKTNNQKILTPPELTLNGPIPKDTNKNKKDISTSAPKARSTTDNLIPQSDLELNSRIPDHTDKKVVEPREQKVTPPVNLSVGPVTEPMATLVLNWKKEKDVRAPLPQKTQTEMSGGAKEKVKKAGTTEKKEKRGVKQTAAYLWQILGRERKHQITVHPDNHNSQNLWVDPDGKGGAVIKLNYKNGGNDQIPNGEDIINNGNGTVLFSNPDPRNPREIEVMVPESGELHLNPKEWGKEVEIVTDRGMPMLVREADIANLVVGETVKIKDKSGKVKERVKMMANLLAGFARSHSVDGLKNDVITDIHILSSKLADKESKKKGRSTEFYLPDGQPTVTYILKGQAPSTEEYKKQHEVYYGSKLK